jgi:CO/xanthine dehydrogenase FAD-binding subunit
MSLHPQYARPRDLSSATALLDSLRSGATIIAGGQELMPHINYGRLSPSIFVDVSGIAALRGISQNGDTISIGALTVHRTVQTDAIIRARLPLLADAARHIGGGRQVHNRGTIGGNIVSMHPLYDIVPPLLALGASVDIHHAHGVRTVTLADLLRETSHGLGAQSILSCVHVPAMKPSARWAYYKLKATEGAYGSANAACVVEVSGGVIAALTLVIGGVSEKLIDATPALGALIGSPVSGARYEELSDTVRGLVSEPLSDQQGEGEWRRAMAGVVARRALKAALSREEEER